MRLKKLLGNQSHWSINKELSREIGLNETLILQHLIDWCDYHKKNTIFQTYEQIQADLGLSEHSVKRVGIPKLKELGFISTERKGVGYKTHYTLHENVIVDFLTRPSREVNSTPLESSGSISPTSKVNSPSLIGESNMSSEVNTTGLIGESTLAISNNISINNVDEEDMTKESTDEGVGAGFNKNIIEKTIIDILLDSEVNIKDYNNAVEEFKELGGINTISEIMEWDDSVKENYYKQIKNVNSIRTNE